MELSKKRAELEEEVKVGSNVSRSSFPLLRGASMKAVTHLCSYFRVWVQVSRKVDRKQQKRVAAAQHNMDPALKEQFNAGRLLACISSRPGQSGRADGKGHFAEAAVSCCMVFINFAFR